MQSHFKFGGSVFGFSHSLYVNEVVVLFIFISKDAALSALKN
jgi:hypothetical protein